MFCTFLKGGGIDCTRSAFVGLAWQAGELEEKYDGFLVITGETSALSAGPAPPRCRKGGEVGGGC